MQEFHLESLANALELEVTDGGVVNDGSAFPVTSNASTSLRNLMHAENLPFPAYFSAGPP